MNRWYQYCTVLMVLALEKVVVVVLMTLMTQVEAGVSMLIPTACVRFVLPLECSFKRSK